MKTITEKETYKQDYLDISVTSQQNYVIFVIFRNSQPLI
jgi:hypothetical protein